MRTVLSASLGLACLFSSAALAQNSSQYAPIVEGNPHGVAYQAILQDGKPVHGSIIGMSSENGTGVHIRVNFYDFPGPQYAPFAYHVHTVAINSSMSCASALGHLSPYGRADQPPCNAAEPWTCQPGDLSGKHGSIAFTNGTYQKEYLDLYLSTDPNSVSFIGNRSVVVHTNNGTRLNCANFHRIEHGNPYGNSSTTTSSASSASSSASMTHHYGSSTASATGIVASGSASAPATYSASSGSTATGSSTGGPSTFTGAAVALSPANVGTSVFAALVGKLLLAVL